jgi:hypothetical protein
MNSTDLAISVRRSLLLWRDVFRLENLPVVAEAADVPQRDAARVVLRLYRTNEIRMSALDAETLANSLKRNYKQEREERKRQDTESAGAGGGGMTQ